MAKTEIEYTDYFALSCETMGAGGLLLVSLDEAGKPNAMTIGWALLGVAWGRPICAVFVRPSRYTCSCIEATGDFTVNVPPPELAEQVLFCGTELGRDYDKLEECGLTATPGKKIKSPGIEECWITHECVVVQKNDVVPAHFAPEIIDSLYAGGDFHRVYFGEIVASYAEVEALRES